MKKLVALLAAATLSVAAHGAAPFSTGQLTGVFNAPLFDELYDPTQPNVAADWMGRSFSASVSWSEDNLYAVDLDGNDEHEREWALVGVGGMTVDGKGAIHPDLTYVAVQHHWVYDGSVGVLPAGTYEVLTLWGAQYCTKATAEPYFGTCLTEAGAPQRTLYSIDLIGSAGMLGGPAGELPLASSIRTDRVLAVLASVEIFANNTQLIGGVGLVDTSAGRLDNLVLTTTAVSEPSSALLCLLGLAAFGVRRLSRAA